MRVIKGSKINFFTIFFILLNMFIIFIIIKKSFSLGLMAAALLIPNGVYTSLVYFSLYYIMYDQEKIIIKHLFNTNYHKEFKISEIKKVENSDNGLLGIGICIEFYTKTKCIPMNHLSNKKVRSAVNEINNYIQEQSSSRSAPG